MQHETGSETDCLPLCKILIYSGSLPGEVRSIAVELAIVVEIVNPYFEPICLEILT